MKGKAIPNPEIYCHPSPIFHENCLPVEKRGEKYYFSLRALPASLRGKCVLLLMRQTGLRVINHTHTRGEEKRKRFMTSPKAHGGGAQISPSRPLSGEGKREISERVRTDAGPLT